MKFSKLIERTAAIEVPYRDETVNLVVFSEKLTPNYKAGLEKLTRENKDIDSDIRMLADLLKSWDVLDEDDAPIAPTYEFLLQCPYSFLTALAEAVLKEVSSGGNA